MEVVGGAQQAAAYSPQGSGGVNSGSCRVRSLPRGKSGEYAGRVNTAAPRLFSPLSISVSVTLLPEIRPSLATRGARVRSHLHQRTGQASLAQVWILLCTPLLGWAGYASKQAGLRHNRLKQTGVEARACRHGNQIPGYSKGLHQNTTNAGIM